MPIIIAGWLGFMALVGISKYRLEVRDAKIAALKQRVGEQPSYVEAEALKDLSPKRSR